MRSRLSGFTRRRQKNQRSKSIPTLFRSHTTRPSPKPETPTPRSQKKSKTRKMPRRRPFSLKRERRKKKHQRRSSTGSSAATNEWAPSLDCESKEHDAVFGVNIEDAMKRYPGKQVQPILSDLCNALRHQITTLGLFRVSPLNTELDQILLDYKQGIKPILNQLDAHMLAGLIKEYFNRQPEPLLTFALYSQFLEYAHDPKSKVDVLHNAMDRLPEVRRHALDYFLGFLCEVVEEEQNLMDEEALARIVTPNLIRPKVISPIVLMQDTRVAFLVIQKLLEEKLDERKEKHGQNTSLLVYVDSEDDNGDEENDFDSPARLRPQTVG